MKHAGERLGMSDAALAKGAAVVSPGAEGSAEQAIETVFRARGWSPFAFQREAWEAYLAGRSGLIHAPTGLGKTWAAWLGAVIEALREKSGEAANGRNGDEAAAAPPAKRRVSKRLLVEPVRVVWITPLRALASDTGDSLREPIAELGLNWSVELRTGDTAASLKRSQRERLPTALVTTPESLTLLLSYPESREMFATLRCVVVDEWHELIGSKRGVQTELALSRLRTIAPALRTWGVSATLGNLAQARDVLLGAGGGPARPPAALVHGDLPKALDIRTVIPADIERFPWAGHVGTKCVPQVIEAVKAANSTLLFTNTRSQAEIWFRRLMLESPDLVGRVAIHHGSLDRALRANVERMLGEGKLKCVVCTSSLDLGVDFAPVDQVLQVGSPKGVARLVQRAGRSGHRPGAMSRVLGVPAHAFELVEFAAAREAAARGEIEARTPIERPLDVLVQHLMTMACAGGFREEELKREVRTAHAFARLSDEEWAWAMEFVTKGGPALAAYPRFARLARAEGATGADAEKWFAATPALARAHRLGIGTITADSSLSVKYLSGKTLGHIEEGFIARLKPGAKFVFAGKLLELVRVREMTAYVARARNKSGIVPRWDGGRFSLSTQLSASVRRKLDEAREGVYDCPEMRAVRPILEIQLRRSIIPRPGELLIESVKVDRVHNAFLFPFQGRAAHEGIGALIAYRLSRRSPMTVTATVNDYGIGLRSDEPILLDEHEWREVLSPGPLLEDLAACLNSSNLARRQFRDIARIAGLIIPGFPGAPKPSRHVQASSEMFFDVFEEFDPGNLLLDQARREVLENQLEIVRLRAGLEAAAANTIVMVTPPRLTPLSFPIWAENLRATTLSSETWSEMVKKMALVLEEAEDRDRARERRTAPQARGRRGSGRAR